MPVHGRAASVPPGQVLQSHLFQHPADPRLHLLPDRMDRAEGIAVMWYKNGKKHSETPYKDGMRDGRQVSWHKDGKKKSEVTYVRGKKHGVEIEWDSNGRKTETTYERGKKR